jgi:hypothetical protein
MDSLERDPVRSLPTYRTEAGLERRSSISRRIQWGKQFAGKGRAATGRLRSRLISNGVFARVVKLEIFGSRPEWFSDSGPAGLLPGAKPAYRRESRLVGHAVGDDTSKQSFTLC